MANMKNCLIIGLAQLNREGSDKPKMHHLKGSSSIEQDSNKVIMLHRDIDSKEDLEVNLCKNRNWNLGRWTYEHNDGVYTSSFADHKQWDIFV